MADQESSATSLPISIPSVWYWSIFGILLFIVMLVIVGIQLGWFLGIITAFAICTLIAIFPIAFLAYQQANDETRIERLKTEFRLLGLFGKDDDENEIEALYRRIYNPFQYSAYITLIVAFSAVLLILFTSQATMWFTQNLLNTNQPDAQTSQNQLLSEPAQGDQSLNSSANNAITDTVPHSAVLDISGSLPSITGATGISPAFAAPGNGVETGNSSNDPKRELSASEVERNNRITLVFISFLGAYVYAVQELVRRYNTMDLLPQVYSSILARILVATAITFVGASAIAAFGSSFGPADAPTPTAGYTTIWGPAVLAFVIGIFPSRGIQWFKGLADRMMGKAAADAPELLIENLLGMSTWHAARLEQMGIDDAQNLAAADLRRLLLTTPFDPQVLVNWIDQAILYVKAGTDKITRFRSAQITTYHELLSSIAHMTGRPIDEIDSLTDAEYQKLDNFALTVGFSTSKELLRLADTANFPNYNHIREYYQNQPALAEQQAEIGFDRTSGLLDENKYQAVIKRVEALRKVRGNRTPAAKLNQLGEAYLKNYYAIQNANFNGADAVEESNKALDLAIEAFRQTITSDSTLEQAYYNLSQCLYFKGELDGTIANCTTAIYRNRAYAKAYVGRAMAYLDLNMWPEAELDLDEALRLDGRLVDAYYNRAVLNIKRDDQNQWQTAFDDLDKAYYCGEPLELLSLQRGNANMMGTQHEVAITYYSAAINAGLKTPLLWEALSNRGLCYAVMDTPVPLSPEVRQRALIDLATGYKNGFLAPENTYQYALVSQQSGDLETAKIVLAKLIDKYKDAPRKPKEFVFAQMLVKSIG